jgi:16S rRNA (uracil1498-N3)-methyltransferase
MRVLVRRGSGEAGKRVSLDEKELRHLKVRRAREGEPVELLDGAGFRGSGRLIQVGREWMVEVAQAELEGPPAPLILAVAAGDRDRFSWLVEKSAELGVTRILPLETRHTAAVATRLRKSHLEHLRRTALEAIKQSGAAWSPEIDDPLALSLFLRKPLSGAGWLAELAGQPGPAALDPSPVTVVIGPEGGLTDDERTTLVAAGYRPVALGPHTLRFETAALAAAAAVTQARMRGAHG